MGHKEEENMPVQTRFHLPPNYYVRVSPWISMSVVCLVWILFPVVAFSPNTLDFIINDHFGDILERNSHYLVKLFNIQVWLHMIECIVALQKCRALGISPKTTMKWLVNVGVHGILALKHLLWPSLDVERIKVH